MEGVATDMEHRVHKDDVNRINELIRACGTGGAITQQEARLALERVGTPAVGPVIQALMHSDHPVVRMRAAEALGHMGDVRAVEPLIRALADKNTAVQWRALEALVDMGEPAMASLKRASKDEDADIRWGAARAIVEYNKKRCKERDREYFSKVAKVRA